MDRTNKHAGSAADVNSPASGSFERRRSLGRRVEDVTRPQSGPAAWSLRDVYRALFQYWKRSLGFFSIVMVMAITALIVCPCEYSSDAWLFVRLGRESVALDPTATTGQVVGLNVTRETEINSIIEVMGSRVVLEKVVDSVGLDPPAESELEREKGITTLMKDITIWSPKNTNVIGVACTARSPERSRKVVSAIVEIYMDEHLRLNSTPGSYEFFDEQSKLLKTQLDEESAALRDAKSQFNLASIEGRRDALQKQVSGVETQILDTESGLAASVAKIESMRSSLDTLPESLLKRFAQPNSSATSLRELHYELQTREQELLAKYTESHPTVIAIRQQVREMERIMLAEQPDRSQATTAAVLAEQSTCESLQARAKALDDQKKRLAKELAVLNQQEVQVKELERNVKVAEANYLAYMASLEQTRVDQALKSQAISNINVIQPASLIHKPTSPKKGLTLAIALIVGVCGGIGLALLSQQLDQSLKTPEDIEKRMGLSTLVSIPYLEPQQLALKGMV